MDRTTIMLPARLKARAQQEAQARGVSLAQLIRGALEDTLQKRPRSRADDPLFRDAAIFRGPSPADTATEHDEYLYGEGA